MNVATKQAFHGVRRVVAGVPTRLARAARVVRIYRNPGLDRGWHSLVHHHTCNLMPPHLAYIDSAVAACLCRKRWRAALDCMSVFMSLTK
jgi:hypothetical protein